MVGHGVVAGPGPVGQAVLFGVVGHEEAAGDVDAVGAGGAVVAPAAELGAQLLADGGTLLQLRLGEGGFQIHGGVAIHLLGGAHAGDHHVAHAAGGDVPQGQGAVVQVAPRQGLHGDGAHALLPGQGQHVPALILHNIIGEHDGLQTVGILLHQDFQGVGAVGGDADVADLPGGLGLRQGLPGAAGAEHLPDVLLRQVVELVQVDEPGAQVGQAGLDVPGHALPVPAHALGGQDELVPPALQRRAQVLLGHGIAPGGVDVVDAVLLQLVHHGAGVFRVGPLDGDAPEGEPGDVQAGAAERDVFHIR